jgi:hypothetical protein
MNVVITYRAPKTGGHSGSFGMQSEMHFATYEDTRDWVLSNIPTRDHPNIKVWMNDLQITGATRESLFRPMPFHWIHPERTF